MTAPKIYLTALDVRRRFKISDMTLWRWLKDERLDFPKPLLIRRRRYFDTAAIEKFECRQLPEAIK